MSSNKWSFGQYWLAAAMCAVSVVAGVTDTRAQSSAHNNSFQISAPSSCGTDRCSLSDLAIKLTQPVRPSGFVWALGDVKTSRHAVGRLVTLGSFARGGMRIPRTHERYCRAEILVMYFVPRLGFGFREQEAIRHLLNASSPSEQPVRHWGNEADRIVGRGIVVQADCEDGRPYDFDLQELQDKLRASGF